MVNIKAIRPGDKIVCEFTVSSISETIETTSANNIDPKYIIEHIPSPIVVGDTVRHVDECTRRVVLAIDGKFAWVKSGPGVYGTYRLDVLTRV